MGVGVLLDRAGNDRYEAASCCHGAAVYGTGALLDLGGADVYIARNHSQAIGGPRGFGILLDAGGSDLYRANGPTPSGYGTPGVFYSMSQGVGLGFRGWDNGGIGILEDLDGNDRYEGGEFSQGGGYFFGLGILHDRAGRDVYFGNRYSQGFAAHEALGVLCDDSGDDTYWGMTAASQGGAWDISMALLLDRAGNDTYRADGLAQGSAAMQAIGWLIDLSGDDHYVGAGSAVQGQSGQNNYHYATSQCMSWSMFVDAGGGADFFSSARANNSTVSTGSMNSTTAELSDLHGLFIDSTDKLELP
jgi:hypothetical protein